MQQRLLGIFPRMIGLLILLALSLIGAPAKAAPNAADTLVYLPVIMHNKTTASDRVFQVMSDSTDSELGNLNCGAWSACRTALYGNYWLNGGADATIESSYSASTGKYTIKRVFLFFDTASLPDKAVVTGARLRFYVGATQSGSNKVHVVRTTAATPPAASGFGALSFTSGGSAVAGPSQWVEITLSPAALSWVHTAGFTRLALVHDLDQGGTAPTGLNHLSLSTWEKTALEPQLLLTYVVLYP